MFGTQLHTQQNTRNCSTHATTQHTQLLNTRNYSTHATTQHTQLLNTRNYATHATTQQLLRYDNKINIVCCIDDIHQYYFCFVWKNQLFRFWRYNRLK